MSFITDQQTLDDLHLLGKYKPGSIYGLFNKVRTRGGERLLDEWFRQPLSDPREINRRTEVFRWLQGKTFVFPFDREKFGLIEDYLGGGSAGSLLTTSAGVLRKRLLEAVVKDEGYGAIRAGVRVTISFLRECRVFIEGVDEGGAGAAHPLQDEVRLIKKILGDRRLAGLPGEQEAAGLSWQKIAWLHHLFVQVLQQEMNVLCETLYYLDLCIAVSDVARERGFSYARALPEQEQLIHAVDLRHPGLNRAVGNSIALNMNRNVLFLTGANMAGKSTFMKAFGIALYLAHMGFPVAAEAMTFSVKDGLYSSINVPDDLSLGYSHFYAEVRRVKTIAEEVSRSKSLVVIFDELFKGTNVKDAYEATLAVTAAFARYRNCCFIISTHITEAGEALREYGNLRFAYLPTLMEGGVARYPYRLQEGISSDRHGMMIIEQEGILDIIRSGKEDSGRAG